MKIIERLDFVKDELRMTKDGYLVTMVNAARTGLYDYLPAEINTNSPKSLLKVYRSDEVVFDKNSLATFVGKPVTNDHPMEDVNAANWKKYSVGAIGEGVLRDKEFIRIPITVMDADAISDIKAGKREVSLGYSCDIDRTPGKANNGVEYDASMSNIKVNHIAIVDIGRAGSKCRIGDENKGWDKVGTEEKAKDEAEKKGGRMAEQLRTVLVDGFSVETTDAGAQAIARLQKELETANKSITDEQASAKKAVDAKDAEIAKKDGEIAELKKNAMTDEQIADMVRTRGDLVADAVRITKDQKTDFSKMKSPEIMSHVVQSVRGKDVVKDKSEAYIEAAFDIIRTAHVDENEKKLRDAMGNQNRFITPGDNGQKDYETHLVDAWKGQKAEKAS